MRRPPFSGHFFDTLLAIASDARWGFSHCALHKTVTKLPHNVAFAELRRYFPRLNVNFLPHTIKSKS